MASEGFMICQGCGFFTLHMDMHGQVIRLLRDSFGRELCIDCFEVSRR